MIRVFEPRPLLPAGMVNALSYCPRLMYLKWVDGDQQDTADTVAGKFIHRNVDHPGGGFPTSSAVEERLHIQSVELSADELGVVAKMDLIEAEGDHVIPVDYKRGSPPDIPERAWEPEQVQLCVQGLILRHNGYKTDRGMVYYAEGHERVAVPFTDDLVARTLTLIEEARRLASRPAPPPPLTDSPKCPRCSLVAICLPDEATLLGQASRQGRVDNDQVRLMFPSRPNATPLYVSEQGTWVSKRGERLVVQRDGQTLANERLIDLSQLCLFGAVQVSTAALRELATREIPVTFLSHGGFFYGTFRGLPSKSVRRRVRQFAVNADEQIALQIAREIVRGKILNQRTLLRRHGRDLPPEVVPRLKSLAHLALSVKSAEALQGVEGAAAALYFRHFPKMLSQGLSPEFDFSGRNRRPPTDPVNAILSLGYALLTKDFTVTVDAVGLDPYVGVFHHFGHGRPALALDLMEEFRPIIVDSITLTLVNKGMLSPSDFVRSGNAVALSPSGRRVLIQAYEDRMAVEAKHPLFGYKISYRRAIEVHARLFTRVLDGELPRYTPYLIR